MILVRDVFRVKFGKAKEAVALWKEGLALNKRAGYNPKSTRILTDLVGPSYYTLVFESTFESLSEYENAGKTAMSNSDWQAWYAKVSPLLETGHREIFTIAGE